MASLKEKHQIASSDPSFFDKKVDSELLQLEKHSKDKDTSVWHFEQTKNLVIEKYNSLAKLDITVKEKLPLFGLSLGVKDLFCVSGMLTTAGSKILENFVSPYDSTVTKQIQDKGALITAKVSMDEFAMGSFTNTSHYGKTSIPGYLDYSPGGSSGGSSAALFADLVDFTIGSDTGGSIRQPSAFCGLVGYKPSYGSFSRYGMISYASSLDQAGFITKTAEDLEYIISSLDTFGDKKDPTSQGFSKLYKDSTPSEITFGYIEDFFTSEDIELTIRLQYKQKLESLKMAGFKIQPFKIDLLKMASEIYYIIACAEASSNLARYQGVYFGKSLVETMSKENKSVDYWEEVASYRSKFFGKEVQKRIMLGSYVLSSEKFDIVYTKATNLRKELTQQINNVLNEVSYLILPTFPTKTPKWKDIEKMTTAQIYLADYMTIGFSLAGLPVVTVPTTKTYDIEKTTGLQIVGRKFSDYQLIKDSLIFEKVISTDKD